MPEYGRLIRRMGGFLFSKKPSNASDQTTQFAACVVASMSSGLYFIDHVTLVYWEHFFPGLALRWYDLVIRGRPTDIDTLRQYERPTGNQQYQFGVGYPRVLTAYYEKTKPHWKPLDVSMDDLQLLTMEFHAAREYNERLGRAALQFAHYVAHHDIVYANPLVKAAISLAIIMHREANRVKNYDVLSTDMSVIQAGRRQRQIQTENPYLLVA